MVILLQINVPILLTCSDQSSISSLVERPVVSRKVMGSIPIWSARHQIHRCKFVLLTTGTRVRVNNVHEMIGSKEQGSDAAPSRGPPNYTFSKGTEEK